MEESLYEAYQELKRVEHQVYVSLKYTRTVDVIINIIKRLIDAYEFAFDSVLKYCMEYKQLESIPDAPLVKARMMKRFFPKDEIIKKSVSSFALFKKIIRAKCEREEEFRRHVTMICIIDKKEVRIDIDTITEAYLDCKEFLDYIKKKIEEKGKNVCISARDLSYY